MKRIKRSITIRDVATASGVSVSTVSRVLNNKDDVSSETYERIRAVISEMGYASSLAARSMRTLRKNIIGLIMPDAGEPFPIEVMKGVNSTIATSDYDLLIYTCGDGRKHFTADREKNLCRYSITASRMVLLWSHPKRLTSARMLRWWQ